MLEFNGTAIVLAISFIIFVILMNFIFYRPMKKILDERNSYITGNENEAKDKKSKAEELVVSRDIKISEAKKQSSEIVNNTTLSAQEIYSKSLSEQKNVIREEEKVFKNDLEQEKDKVQNELKQEIVKFSGNIISKILGKEVTLVNITDETIEKALRGEL